MKSIKKQLMFSILAVTCFSTLVMIIITYIELKTEMDELFDENMMQIAHAIYVHDFAGDSSFAPQETNQRQRLKGEEEFLIQIWNKDKISYSSLPALKLPRQGVGGVKTIFYDNQAWRYYAIAQNDWLIQVSQPILERHSVIREVYSEIMIPMLVQLPVLIGMIWFFVGYGFRPLKRISSSIEKRSSAFLDKLPEKNVPQEVKAMVGALNNLLERLDGALKAQRQFTADAAHELRTPLTVITLQLDILRRAKTEEEKQEAIKALCKGVDRSVHLVQQLLELARQEPTTEKTPLQKCDLQDILQGVAEQYKPLAQSKNIELKIIKTHKAFIEGDRNALLVMIGNIVGNAITYTQQNGKVHLSVSNTSDIITLSIADNGPGIPEEEQNRIFDRFYRVLNSDTTGSGLGLSIVKAISNYHKSTVNITEGLDGRGVNFEIVFSL